MSEVSQNSESISAARAQENSISPELFDEQLLKLVITLGHYLQKCAAETYRVEESCSYLLNAYGCTDVEVFAVANYISLAFTGPSGKEFSAQKRLHLRSDNLRKIDLLNAKTRQICEQKPSPEQALKEIEAINALPSYSFPAQVLICGLVGFGFTFLLKGSLAACAYAFGIDVVLRLLLELFYKEQTNRIFVNIIGGMIVTFLAWPCRYLGLADEMNFIVAGSFMYLFPGIALMNSIRDIIASDYLAGLTKLLETILVAMSIAIGSGLALSLLNHWGGM